MWIKALSPIKFAPDDVRGPDAEPFEVDDADGASLVEAGVAVEIETPPAAPVKKK